MNLLRLNRNIFPCFYDHVLGQAPLDPNQKKKKMLFLDAMSQYFTEIV